MDFLGVQNQKAEALRVIRKFGSLDSPSVLSFESEERLFTYVLVPLKQQLVLINRNKRLILYFSRKLIDRLFSPLIVRFLRL
jgi:hypothetical protein